MIKHLNLLLFLHENHRVPYLSEIGMNAKILNEYQKISIEKISQICETALTSERSSQE
jgi:hypothetical protein